MSQAEADIRQKEKLLNLLHASFFPFLLLFFALKNFELERKVFLPKG